MTVMSNGTTETVATQELGVLTGHTKLVSRLAFSPDESHIASCSSDKTTKIWSVESRECKASLSGHTGGISDVCWHPRQDFVATVSDDLHVSIWDSQTGQNVRKMSGHTHFVYCCNFHPNGNVLVSGGMDEKVVYWDIRTGHSIKQIPAHSDPVTSLDFTWDGTILATASSDGLCRMWDFGTGLCLKTLMAQNSPPVSHICFSPNGYLLLESVLDNSLRLWNWKTGAGKVVRSFSGHSNSKYCLPACFMGSSLASASEDGTIAVWNINTGKVRKHDVNVLPLVSAEVAKQETGEVKVEGAKVEDPKKDTIMCPETPIAFDMQKKGTTMATSQIGDTSFQIRLAAKPDLE